MINGNPNEFIDTIYTCQDVVFIFNNTKYWFQGYMTDKGVHMEVFIVDSSPLNNGYIWEYNGNSILEGQNEFQNAKIFNGKSFWEAENEIEWVDA